MYFHKLPQTSLKHEVRCKQSYILPRLEQQTVGICSHHTCLVCKMALTLAAPTATLLFSTVQFYDSFSQHQQSMRFSRLSFSDHLEHQGLVSDMDHWDTRLYQWPHTRHVRIPDDVSPEIVTFTPAGPGRMIATLPAPCLLWAECHPHSSPGHRSLLYVLVPSSRLALCSERLHGCLLPQPSWLSTSLARSACEVFFGFVAFPVVPCSTIGDTFNRDLCVRLYSITR